MPLLYAECKAEVKRLLKAQYTEMLKFVNEAKPPLWGEERPRFFVEKVFVLAMFHDITGEGYNKILKELEDLGFTYNPKSYKYNTKSIRRTLAKWRRKKVKLGVKSEWEQSMKKVAGRQRFPDLCFWIDSTDFAMCNKGGKKRKDENWSFKCNSKGRRYMILRDGKGRIRKMWGVILQRCMMGTLWSCSKIGLRRS